MKTNQFRPVPGAPPRGDVRAWGGIAFPLLFVASLVLGAALSSTSLFLPAATGSEVRDYYLANASTLVWQGALQLAAAACLVLFFIALTSRLPRSEAGPGGSPRVIVAVGGWGAVAALVLSVGLSIWLVSAAADATVDDVSLIGRAALILGGPAHLVSLAVAMAAAAASSTGPSGTGWLRRYSLMIAPLLLLSVASIAVPTLVRLEPFERLATFVWTGTVAVRLARSAGGHLAFSS